MTALLATLFAQGQGYGGYGLVHIIKIIIIVAACLGILFVFLRVSGVNIPQWVWQIVFIVVAAVVAIVAIEFLVGL